MDVRTSRDKKSVGESISEIAQKSMEAVQENLRLGYNRLRDEHVSAWEANLWNRCIGKIFGGSEEEKEHLIMHFTSFMQWFRHMMTG